MRPFLSCLLVCLVATLCGISVAEAQSPRPGDVLPEEVLVPAVARFAAEGAAPAAAGRRAPVIDERVREAIFPLVREGLQDQAAGAETGEAGYPPLGVPLGDHDPLGYTGTRRRNPPRPHDLGGSDYFPIEDRWRIGFPSWDRYIMGRLADPYNLNVLKGDYPVIGDNIFFAVTAFSDSFFEQRRIPARVANVDQQQFRQNVLLTFDLFQSNNFFRPAEWLIRITPAFNATAATALRKDNFDAQLQEGFIDKQLAIVSDYYDAINLRVGRQGFVSDFRGLLFADVNDAARLFGTWDGNRTQWNIFGFYTVQKDAVSQFNTFDARRQTVAGANLIRQDFQFRGWNVNCSALYDGDRLKNHVDAVYLELAGDGHIGRVNVSTAFIQALGHDDFNPIARRSETICGQFGALELAYPINWFVPKVSLLYASGDANPKDGYARGYDSIFDNPLFAGNGFSYFNREAVAPGGVILSNTFSFLPNLRTKANDPVNFVNPGLLLVNMGFDSVLTTRLKAQFNVNYYRLNRTEPAEARAQQLNGGVPVQIGHDIGVEPGIGLIYKPLIIDNVVVTFGASALIPSNAITDLSGSSQTLFTTFGALTLIY